MNTGGKRKRRIAAYAGIGTLCALGLALYAMAGHGPSGPPQKDMAVDAPMRSAVVEGLVASLERYYVDPAKVPAVAKDLRARLQHGDLAAIASAQDLADRLTAILQEDTHDRHLVVAYSEQAVPVPVPGQDQNPAEAAAELLESQHHNFGFETVQRLHGDLGYVDVHGFGRPQQIAGRIAATMALMADTKALIVDLRDCRGGDPDGVMEFASYLFDRRTHLNDVWWQDEKRLETRWTTDTVPGARYGSTRKLYLLTSSDTFSGCEDFAYALKYAGRATLVGETTGGGAHAGSPRRLEAHFQAFVPSGRPINPVTHADWEGVGVTPDIPASAKDALTVAQVAALKALIPVESDPDWKDKLEKSLADLQ